MITMPIMITCTMSIKEKLVEMAHAIAKLIKFIEKKDLQITTFMSKVET